MFSTFSILFAFTFVQALFFGTGVSWTYAAPNKWWIIIALALAALCLCKGIVVTALPCEGSIAMWPFPELSDNWLWQFLALIIGASLRTLTLLIGGWFISPSHRLIAGLFILSVFAFYSFDILFGFERLIGLERCGPA
jgi:hypothetical protein